MSFHSGFVCILGRPNAGKSTLLNALVGEKLAIISPKPQTTRNRIEGIIHIPPAKRKLGGQIVLIDTPGVHRPDSSLGKKMMAEVSVGLEGCDLILLIYDVKSKTSPEDNYVLEMLKQTRTPAFLLLNKIDLLPEKARLLPILERFQTIPQFKQFFPISALKRDGLEVVLQAVLQQLPAGPKYFPEDQVTNQPVRFMAAELIREQILRETREEVPYAVTVRIENFEEGKTLTRIAAAIYCERNSHKVILVGKGGQMLKKIGTAARLDIEKLVGTKVYLELFVKVQERWRDSPEFVDEMDWRRQLENLTGRVRE